MAHAPLLPISIALPISPPGALGNGRLGSAVPIFASANSRLPKDWFRTATVREPEPGAAGSSYHRKWYSKREDRNQTPIAEVPSDSERLCSGSQLLCASLQQLPGPR